MEKPSAWQIRVDNIEIESPGFKVAISNLDIHLLSLHELKFAVEAVSLKFSLASSGESSALSWRELIQLLDTTVRWLPVYGRIETVEACLPDCITGQVNWRNQDLRLDLTMSMDMGPGDENMMAAVMWAPGNSRVEITGSGAGLYLFSGSLQHNLHEELSLVGNGYINMSTQPFQLEMNTPVAYEVTVSSLELGIKAQIPLDTSVAAEESAQWVNGSVRLASEVAWRVNNADSSLTGEAPLVLDLGFQAGAIELTLVEEVAVHLESPLIREAVVTLSPGTACVVEGDAGNDIRCSTSVTTLNGKLNGKLDGFEVSIGFEDVGMALKDEDITIQATADVNLRDDETMILASGFDLTGLNGRVVLSTDKATVLGVNGVGIKLGHDTESKKGQVNFRLASSLEGSESLLAYLEIPLLALEKGELMLAGGFEWDLALAGKDAVVFSSNIEIKDMDLEYGGYRLKRGELKVLLAGWPRIRSPQAVEMSWRQFDMGVPVDDIQLRFMLEIEPFQRIFRISGHSLSAKIFGGSVDSRDYSYDVINGNGYMNLNVEALELNQILMLEREDFISTGKLRGSVPVQIEQGKLSVSKGLIAALHPGGMLKYQPSQSVVALIDQNESLKVVVDAMSDFHYHSLEVELEYSPEGELVAKTALKGSNPGYENGREINLNLNLEENLGALLESLRLSEDVTRQIDRKAKSGVF